jgi:hypothetical protein
MRLSSIKDELNKYGVVDEDGILLIILKVIDWYKTRLECTVLILNLNIPTFKKVRKVSSNN